jgi:DNA repair protein RadC
MFIRDMPTTETPTYRAQNFGMSALSTPEILQLITCAKDLDQVNELYALAGGDLGQLAEMTIEEICQVAGFGEKTAIAVKAAFELGRRQHLASEDFPQVRSPSDAAQILMWEIGHEQQEHLMVLLINTRGRVVGKEIVYKGTADTATIRTSEVLRPAVRRNVTQIIIGHNHPSGNPTPSPEDIHITEKIRKAAVVLDIDLLDHIVVGPQRYISMKERKLGF